MVYKKEFTENINLRVQRDKIGGQVEVNQHIISTYGFEYY